MEVLHNLLTGLSVALSPVNLLYCLLGATVGNLIGVLPGIGPVTAMALLLPFTFGRDPINALIMLAGIYYGAMYGGAVTSVLLNIPGEPSAVPTAIEGYSMAKQGRAGAALGMAAISSFVAGTISVVLMTFLHPCWQNWLSSLAHRSIFIDDVGLCLVTTLSGNLFFEAGSQPS
jgi:putative tricarboxylic transport membrane protein